MWFVEPISRRTASPWLRQVSSHRLSTYAVPNKVGDGYHSLHLTSTAPSRFQHKKRDHYQESFFAGEQPRSKILHPLAGASIAGALLSLQNDSSMPSSYWSTLTGSPHISFCEDESDDVEASAKQPFELSSPWRQRVRCRCLSTKSSEGSLGQYFHVTRRP